MLQPFAVSRATLEAYRSYVRSSFPLRDAAVDSQREALIDDGLLWAEPYVSLGRPGAEGPRLDQLTGLILPATLALPWGFERLYEHQDWAIQRLAPAGEGGPQNTLVLSGTGSGKTESFLIPIVDACLRDPGPGVKALVIYPMNALANDQLKRLRGLLEGAPEVTFGRYTGDSPETDAGDARRPGRPSDAPPNLLWSRQAMRDSPPNILLTNYTQLEYLLLRRRDSELFAYGPPRYLVVDEIHLFTGILGSEVACLLRRFRQHVKAPEHAICMVGTSATAGSEDEEARLVEFAERFFGANFDDGGAIAEVAAPLRDPGDVVPPSPVITEELLAAAGDSAGLAALARATFGLDLPAGEDLGEALGAQIDRFRTVSVVERALARPAPVRAAAVALGQLPERAAADLDALGREALAILLLGAAADQAASGEEGLEPRFRPRVHQVVRSLAGLWRCLRAECGRLLPPGRGRCHDCGALALPLASCRTCGEAYWTAPIASNDVDELHELRVAEPPRGELAAFLAHPSRLAGLIDADEDGTRVVWSPLSVCVTCGGAAPGGATPSHTRSCPVPTDEGSTLLASSDGVHCPSCGDQGRQGRPIVLPLRGSAAASVAVLTQALSDELRAQEGEAGGRLLVFADSRQDAAQQAGYASDQGARIAVRQLVVDALRDGSRTLPDVMVTAQAAVLDSPGTLRRWLVGESGRRIDEVADPQYLPSTEDEEAIKRQLAWEIALDATERARRRFSLEQEGLVAIDLDKLDEVVAGIDAAWPHHPFQTTERLREVVLAVVDVLRYARAVDHWMLRLPPRTLIRNHHVRIGDRGVTATRGFAAKRFSSAKAQVDIRGWTAPKNQTRLSELMGRVLGVKATQANDVALALAERMQAAGLLSQSKIEGRTRLMLDHKRLVLAPGQGRTLWRCERCGAVRSSRLSALDGAAICANWRCPGQPAPHAPLPERDFYRRQYTAEPRRLIVREHSGQIEGDERIALEGRFNDREHPVIDVLACTPTLEVGVSLDDLHAVILRNLPPTPASYAQRVGRAGRRSKVALAVAHAGQSPYDSYFFERPEELIAGLVRAPAISLDNEPLLRRHVNSLVMETLGIDLPTYWVPPAGEEATFPEPTVADGDGVLRESTLEPFAAALEDPKVRQRVEAAVAGAFAAPGDPAPPQNAESICAEQIEGFTTELRAALERWCSRYRAVFGEFTKLRSAKGVPTKAQEELEARLRTELRRMAEPRSPEHQPLGFLGLVGFLPRYGFTGTSVLLTPPAAEEPIVQAGWVAVTEFAPGNIVYARGRKLRVRRLEPPPVREAEAGAEHRENVLRHARRCARCDLMTLNPLEMGCGVCGADLVGQEVIEVTGVRASGGTITSEDEYRARSYYDVGHLLGEPRGEAEVVTIAGFRMERTAGRDIVVVNRGPQSTKGRDGPGFDVCTVCGYAEESRDLEVDGDDPDEQAAEGMGHLPTCPAASSAAEGQIQRGVWLTAAIRGDVLEIRLPEAARGPHYSRWRATLAEALSAGIRDLMQAGRRDISHFERSRDGEPWSIVIFDTMPGGTGYLPKLFADDGLALRLVAANALQRLEGCDCESSCHRCLRDFWNQRVHEQLDRFEVMGTLRRLAEGHATPASDPQNEVFESFLEIEFFERLKAAGLPAPTLQVVRELGGQRIIRVDAEYRDPDISIFLDGREYHATSSEKIADDIEIRNRLEDRGICVLEFTYGDVMERFDEVAATLKSALSGDNVPALDLGSLPGVEVLNEDAVAHRARVRVSPNAWLQDERARQASLESANRMRLAGWRLRREIQPGGGG